ncbi:BREX-2 system adenine-specific DNA-methyltransferase PglX [Saccharopolyspora sp. K220]|uniref:BREX-2 system adenine-specific DNA-methyltransferase PglX n=1 Tax=Saccharopolyspora soli TaxID=2926618 RepID=UPI001F55CECB|nr:BREX-2 system adenine-specific DNA-methyltransferase PglX [Saccharopolyspora soli]MCI2423454.1 BREX-2 system adenine-specific DNA-methyltransferase PglX [Saccharopolyspora soli]
MTGADHSETEVRGSRLDPQALLADLQPVLKNLEDDLRERCERPGEMRDWVRGQWQKSVKANRSAATESAYREDLVTQGAVAWVLGTVFVRWCEDNGLIDPHLSGPGERREQAEDAQVRYFRDPAHRLHTHADWIKEGFATLRSSDAGRLLFNQTHNPVYRLTPSETAARELVEFWRIRTGDGDRLVHDFTDGGDTWDTRFLGDLYQDLSAKARDKYALLQTPEFVEEFILDYTLTPAIREFGLEGLRTIDPACGSGHFLLGIFHRLLEAWEEHAPAKDRTDIARLALDSVHGVDVNPFAIAIARFRLMLAAWQYVGITRLSQTKNQSWGMAVAVWDSLLDPEIQDSLFDQVDERANDWEDITDYGAERLLERGTYHAVVGNPPYITVSDSKQNEMYRKFYKTTYRQYQLTVPFAERFFQLAKQADEDRRGSGFVGQITSNAFMKREFGVKLVTEFFPKLNLTHVIDTSGAYIPGHGTPTVILFGRRTWPFDETPIRAVLGIRGEPSTPENPAEGLVWQAMLKQIDTTGSESEWVSVADVERARFSSHPWSLSGGGADELTNTIRCNSPISLGDIASAGSALITGNDDAFTCPAHIFQGRGPANCIDFIRGEDILEWVASSKLSIPWPYSVNYGKISGTQLFQIKKWHWPRRSILRRRKRFGTPIEEISNIDWWEPREIYPNRTKGSCRLVYNFVSTHIRCALHRQTQAINHANVVINITGSENRESKHLEILGILNSSAACFWLKQVSHNKGSTVDTKGARQTTMPWENFYEFTGTKIQELPLPATCPLDRARRLDTLAQKLTNISPETLAKKATPTASRLSSANQQYILLRDRMIAEQEELDWDVYQRYGLLNDEEALAVVIDDPESVPGIALGERAFEIVLARKMAAGEIETQWFARHGSTPVTDLPAHWPEFYRKVVEARIELIERRRDLALIERPECKRRWNTESWESQEQRALRTWLLDRLEDRDFWFDEDSQGYVQPMMRSVLELTDLLREDEQFTSVAALWAGHVFGDPETRLRDVLGALVDVEHVPFLAAYRYKPSGLRLRAEWEHVWDLQRREDGIADRLGKEVTHPKVREAVKEKLGEIPVPSKYKSSDFAKNSYWRHRGKLDVPKERFLSYPAASRDNDGSLLLGWAGWNHREQAQALAILINQRSTEEAWEFDRLVPMLAGLRELLPWVKQWHPDVDPDFYETPYDTYRGFLDTHLAGNLADAELAEWTPTARVNTSPLPRKARAKK